MFWAGSEKNKEQGQAGNYRGERMVVYPALFQKLEKGALILMKKYPDYGHLLFKFLT